MKRIVIKVGSGVLTESNNIAKERMLKLVEFISDVKKIYDEPLANLSSKFF